MTIRNPLVLGGSLGITQLQSTDTLYNVYQPCWYGDGYDGNLTANSAISLSRDMYYNTLTPVSGCAINTKNFRIFCNTLDLSSAPTGAFITTASIFGGGNASGSTAGAGAYFLNGGASGTAGQTSAGNNTAGTAGATGNSGTPSGAYGSNMIINATGTGQTVSILLSPLLRQLACVSVPSLLMQLSGSIFAPRHVPAGRNAQRMKQKQKLQGRTQPAF